MKCDRQIQFFETVLKGKMLLPSRQNVALMNIYYSGEEDEDKEEVGNDDAEQMMVRRTTMVPDSLMPNDDENFSLRVPVGRTPTPKRKTKKRTREMTKDDENDDTEREEEEEEETMVVTNTQLTTPAKAQKTTRSLDATKKSYSSSHRHHQHRQRMRSPLMETQKNATEEDEEEDSEEFKGRSLSPTAEFREAQKIAFNSTNEKKKTKEFTEYDDDDEEEETFDILKKKEKNLVNVNAYGETIRVADTLAIDNVNNNDNNITEERDDDDENNKTSTKKRGRGKVDFQFGDRHTEEQDFEDGKNGVVAVAETFTPIRETVPAPSGMHVCDDDDEEKEDKDEKEADEKDGVLPLREIFRAKHLIDPRDASRTAPVLEVQVLRDESFSYRHVAARTTIQTIQTTTPKTAVMNHDHYLAYEIDHEIRDATEISVWKIETDNCNSSSRRERSGSDDSKTMSRFSFKGTVLIGKPSARDGRTSSSSKGGGGNAGGKTMKRWAFSIAPNGLVFTSSYKKSSLLSMMDETERTHGSNNSSDSDDYSDDSDDEDTYLYGMNSAERRRRFPRKSGVYVHDPVDVNEEESVHKKDSSLGSEKKSNQSQKRRSSGRRRSKTPRDSFGNSMADTKKNQKTTKKQTYFELQSPGMAGKVRPRKFASAFSEEYDETVFRLAGVGAEGKCRLWTWSCENNEDFDDDVNDDDEKKMSSSSSKKKSKSKNKTKFSTAKICAKSVTHCKDFEIPTYKSHCVSRECEITSLSFSKDGNVLACVFDKKHVVVWDASTTRVVFSYYCTEYEIERDGLRVLDNNKKMMKQRGQKSTPSRPNASNSKMKKKKSTFTTSADATSTGGGGPIFFFGNFRKISSSSDSSSPSSVATFACAYNKELVVGPNASWESLNKANNGSDIVSAVAVCPDVFVEEDDEEDEEEEDEEEEDDEYDVKMIKAASKRNTTVNVVVTNAGRLGVFEAFGHANEATHAYEGLTFTKRHAFDEEDVNDDGKTNKSHKKKAFQGNFLCASHGNLFAVARKRPGCVSLYAQENHHHFEESF